MANQMIALGVRGPQLPNLGAAAAQMGNVMANMAVAREKQAGVQRANAFRQLISSPGFDPSNPESIKAAQALDPAGAEKIASAYDARQKAQLERIGEQTKQFRDILAIIDPNDKETYAQFRDEVVSAVPGWASRLPTPEQWNADTRLRTLMKADDVISKTIATPTATPQQDINGYFYESRVGGLGPKGVFPLDTYEKAPPRKGTVSVEPSQTVEPGVGGPLEAAPMSTAPMMPGAKSPRLSADLASPLLNVRDEASYQQALQMIGNVNPNAANQLRRIMPRFDPARMEGIREAAFAEFEKVAQPSQGLVAGERGGVGGPDETVDGFINTGRQFRGKSPMQSPLPGSAQVPISRIAAEKRAEAQAQKDVDLAAEQAKKLPGKKQVSTILGKMRDAYEQLEKAEAIPSEKRGTIANALDYIGSSALGREAQKFVGTEQSKYLSRIVNMRKALATAIKNATGMSAQEMNSNVELQLTLDTLTDPTQGIEAARMALADLEELYGLPKAAAPARAGRGQRAPNIDDLLKKYGD